MPEQLEPKELPYELHYLWSWFNDLSSSRGYAEFGPLPLTYQELRAWADMTMNIPTAWEIDVIRNIDRAYIEETMKK